jgi:hypothetical protein
VCQPPAESFTSSAEDRWEQPAASPGELWGSEAEAIEPVEPDLPIHANLIEFPRELVATRKIRPRLAEGASADADAERQLSIFEVDPGTISTEPEAASSASDAGRIRLVEPGVVEHRTGGSVRGGGIGAPG